MVKKRRKKSKNYFTQETEDYIVKYNNEPNPEVRSKIYETHIHYPFFNSGRFSKLSFVILDLYYSKHFNGRGIPFVVFSSQQNSTNHDFANVCITTSLFARYIFIGKR